MNKKIIEIIKWLWMALVLAGAAYYFHRNQQTVVALFRQISALRLLASLLLLIIGKLFLVLLVQFSVEPEGWNLPFWHALGIYGSTALGKYIPGGVWHFVGRFGIYRANGLDNKQFIRALILENIWLLSAAVIVGLVALLFYRLDLIRNWFGISLSVRTALILFILALLLWFLALVLAKSYYGKQTKLPIRPLWQPALAGIMMWIFAGLSFFVMFEEVLLNSAGLFIGGYAISWVVGYFAVFAPGGVGIREAMLVLVFANIGSAETISVYAAMNRIVWLVAELIFGLTGYLQKTERGIIEQKPQQ